MTSVAPVSAPRPRILIGGGGEEKTLRLVAHYADACNFFGEADAMAAKVDVLRRHCDAVDRDTREIEVTALLSAREHWTVDDVVRAAETYADVGVGTIMAPAIGNDPAGKLESLFGPAMGRLATIQPRPL